MSGFIAVAGGLAGAALWWGTLKIIAMWLEHRERVAQATRAAFRARLTRYVRGAW